MKIKIIDEGNLPGLDEIFLEQEEDFLTDMSYNQVKMALKSSGYPIESTMGLRDNLRGIIERFYKRRLIRELPEIVHSITWLEFHIPKSGSGTLTSSKGISTENAVEFALFGSGMGSGRKAKLVFEESSDERKDCVRYVVLVRIKPKIYKVKMDETVVLDVIGLAGEAIEPFSACPYCGIDTNSIDRFEHRLDPFLDLRKETVSHQHIFTVESVKDLNMKIGTNVPGLEGSKLNLSANMSFNMTWKIKYNFSPGFLYQPYWRLNGTPPHTPMWAISV